MKLWLVEWHETELTGLQTENACYPMTGMDRWNAVFLPVSEGK